MPMGFCDDGFEPDSGPLESGTAEPSALTCVICGESSQNDGFLKIHLPARNLLVLRCRSCGFAWDRPAILPLERVKE